MKERNPLAVFGLSIITLGIYDIYWLVKTKKVLNEVTNQHVPTIWLLFAPPVLIIVGYILIFANTVSNISSSFSYNNGSTVVKSGHDGAFFGGLAAVIIGFILTFLVSTIWFFKYSKAVNEYTRGQMSTAVSFLTLFLVHIIGVALIQDAFNEVIKNPSGPNYGSPVNPLPPQNPPVSS